MSELSDINDLYTEAQEIIQKNPRLAWEIVRQWRIRKKLATDPALQGGLTRRQRDTLDFVRAYVVDNRGQGPSYDEIKDALQLRSKSNVFRLVNELEARGYVRRMPNQPRSLTLLDGV